MILYYLKQPIIAVGLIVKAGRQLAVCCFTGPIFNLQISPV